MTRRTAATPLFHNTAAAWLWAISALFIIYGTSIPFQFTSEPGWAAEKFSRLSLNVLMSPESGRRASVPDMVQNILLFVPFGVFGMIAIGWRKYGIWRVALVTVMGAVLSSSVEVLQLFTIDRTSSLNDLLTNTTGALVGALCAPLATGTMRRLIAALLATGINVSEAMFPLVVAFAMVVLAAWHPFDASLDVGDLIPKARALVENPWQAGVFSDEGLDFLRWALFGVAAVAWLRQSGARHPVLVGAALGATAAVALEASQFIIGSRMPGLKDMSVQATGAVLGAGIAPWALGRWSPAFGALVVIGASWLGAAMQMLSPFVLAASPQPIVWFPFLAYYEFTSTQTVSHVIELALMFFPVGFLLTLANPGVSMWVGATITMLILAVPLEYAQAWVVGRFPDITDVGMSVGGGLLGVWAGRAGLARYQHELESSRHAPPAAELRDRARPGGSHEGYRPAVRRPQEEGPHRR